MFRVLHQERNRPALHAARGQRRPDRGGRDARRRTAARRAASAELDDVGGRDGKALRRRPDLRLLGRERRLVPDRAVRPHDRGAGRHRPLAARDAPLGGAVHGHVHAPGRPLPALRRHRAKRPSRDRGGARQARQDHTGAGAARRRLPAAHGGHRSRADAAAPVRDAGPGAAADAVRTRCSPTACGWSRWAPAGPTWRSSRTDAATAGPCPWPRSCCYTSATAPICAWSGSTAPPPSATCGRWHSAIPDTADRTRAFQQLADLTTTVPIYQFHRPMTFETLPDVVAQVMALCDE